MSNLIGRHCRTMPGTQKSTGNIMYVRYYTDVPEPRQGFKAEVKIGAWFAFNITIFYLRINKQRTDMNLLSIFSFDDDR